MDQISTISLSNLSLMSIPLIFVGLIYKKFGANWQELIYATIRMVSQLLIVGFALNFVFAASHPVLTSLIFLTMLSIAAWIATRKSAQRAHILFKLALALFCGVVPVLGLVLTSVIPGDPWYRPSYFIPLAGMILSNSMNALSLAVDQMENRSEDLSDKKVLETALLPTTNSFFAVGLVSLPGMMTGQILSGVSPLIAVRYQIVVMAMVLGAAGVSVGCYIWLESREKRKASLAGGL